MEEIQKDSYAALFRTIWRTLAFAWKNERTLFICKLLFSIAGAILVYVQLVSFSSIVDEIVRIKQLSLGITKDLIRNGIILGASFLVPSVISNLDALFDTMLRNKVGTKMNLHLVDVYSNLDIGTFEGPDFQKKKDRASKWGLGSINNVIYWFMSIVRGIAGVVVGGIVLYSVNPYFVVFAIAGALPYYFIEQTYGKKIFNLAWVTTDENRIEADRIGYFRDPKKIVEVLLFSLASFFKKQISDIANAYDRKLISISKKEALVISIADIFQTACLFAIIILATYETLQGNILIGALFLAFTAYRSFLSTIQTFFTNYARLTEQARYAKYWFDIFDIKPKLLNKVNALKPDWQKPPVIEFKNVFFSYPETETVVLKNISFTLESGEKLAMVGLNGAGKTTLIKLLCRVYDPTEGQVLIDGVDLRDIDLPHWHKCLGVLFQDFTNYQLTVRESIAISRPEEPIDDERVHKAAEISGAKDFIEELPKKYDQLLWKGFQDGVELSKGQHQRLAVARIFYRDALISILDEPTSAIDAVAEEKIFEVLETKMEGKTSVLISHRFSTVKNADKIAVVEHGEIKELGSHKELMTKNGRYAELYNMQASRYLESE